MKNKNLYLSILAAALALGGARCAIAPASPEAKRVRLVTDNRQSEAYRSPGARVEYVRYNSMPSYLRENGCGSTPYAVVPYGRGFYAGSGSSIVVSQKNELKNKIHAKGANLGWLEGRYPKKAKVYQCSKFK